MDDTAVVVRRTRSRDVTALIAVQYYVVVAYLATAVVPALWSPRPYPPTWTWIVPAWLLGVPGFWIVMFGPLLAGGLALTGGAVLRRPGLSPARRRAVLVGTAAVAALAVWSMTPPGWDLMVRVMD